MHSAIASYLAKKPFVLIIKDIKTFDIDQPVEVLGEDYEEDTNISYYFYIIDVPEHLI